MQARKLKIPEEFNNLLENLQVECNLPLPDQVRVSSLMNDRGKIINKHILLLLSQFRNEGRKASATFTFWYDFLCCVSMPMKSVTVQANQLSSAEIQMSLKLIKCLKVVHTSILSRFLIYLLNWFTLLLVQLVPLISRRVLLKHLTKVKAWQIHSPKSDLYSVKNKHQKKSIMIL